MEQKNGFLIQDRMYNDLGVFYRHGLGCALHNDCFNCPETECRFQVGTKRNDMRFLSNRGDGIKEW